MLILLTSPSAFGNPPSPGVAQALIEAKANGNPTALVSNHGKPQWFDTLFTGSNVQFIKKIGRQDGHIVSHNAQRHNLNPFDVMVLVGSDADLQMGKNGGALLVAAGWTGTRQTRSLGIQVANETELKEVLRLTSQWSGQWWFTASESYSVRALADLSTYHQTNAQEVFAGKLKTTIKNGGSKLNSLLAVTARSLLMDGFATADQLLWGVYPSSASDNQDNEVLSDFTQRLRTTVSRVRFAKRGEPLFIRHTISPKRSAGASGDRTDPASQIKTMHINPFYKGKLYGKNVVVIDDCTTYGVSFGVAAALLRSAGASSVTGIALGKFGNQLRHYAININDDPFAPIVNYQVAGSEYFQGITNNTAKNDLSHLI